MDLDDITRDLYALPPGTFTAARNQRAKELGAAGQRDVAAALRKLPRPTLTAWLANSLARTDAPTIDALIALGPELRRAQAESRRQDMRDIVDRRGELIRLLMATAAEMARRTDHPFAPPAQRQLQETLEAAVADPATAALLRHGTLSAPQRFVGFGPSPPAGAAGRTASSRTQATAAHRRALAAAEAAREAARDEHRSAEAAVSDAGDVLRRAQQNVLRVKRQVEKAETAYQKCKARMADDA